MDCMEAMRSMPDKCFDLAVVDPPYGIGESGNKNHTRSRIAKAKDYKAFHGYDKQPPAPEYFRELCRVSKNQIIFGANHFANRLEHPESSCWIVWDKENGANDFADCELAWTSFKSRSQNVPLQVERDVSGRYGAQRTSYSPHSKARRAVCLDISALR